MAFCSTGPLNENWSSILSSRIFTRPNIPAFSTHECAYRVKYVNTDLEIKCYKWQKQIWTDSIWLHWLQATAGCNWKPPQEQRVLH